MIKYRAFIKVIELGSITKAARTLGYSQPGISHMLDALEQEVGFPLLIRNKDRIIPTEDGKRILACCNQIIKDEDNLRDVVQSITGLVVGNLNIVALNSMLVSYVPNVTSTFLNAYSSIKVKLEEKPFSEAQTALINGNCDIAFISECKTKGIEFYHLFKDPICLLIPEGHPFASYDKVPVSALNGCDFIMPLPGWDDPVHMITQKYNITPNVKHYVASDTAGIALVNERQGVYVVSKLQAQIIPSHIIVKEFEEDIHRNMGYAVRSMRNITPALNEFIKTSKVIAEEYIEK